MPGIARDTGHGWRRRSMAIRRESKHRGQQIQAVVWGVERNGTKPGLARRRMRGDHDEDVATISPRLRIGSAVKRDLSGNRPIGKSLYINKVSLTSRGPEHRGTMAETAAIRQPRDSSRLRRPCGA